MPYSVDIIADSFAPCGERLVSYVISYPRFVHADLMTHRQFSRNASSSRAIPIEKMIERAVSDPAYPLFWGKRQKGMSTVEEIDDVAKTRAKEIWDKGRLDAIETAKELMALGLSKEIVNRGLEPYTFITVIVSATEFENFFHLRCSPQAQAEIRWVAEEMRCRYDSSTPRKLRAGEWHLPFITDEDRHEALNDIEILKKVSTARAARVSYLTHFGKRDLAKDIELHDQLLRDAHLSPTEHVAMALQYKQRIGNLVGFRQYRKTLPNENVTVRQEGK